MRWRSTPSARLLIARLELLFERCELGEWRIGVGLPALRALGATLDVFRAQRWIAIRTIAARGTITARSAAAAIASRGAIAISLRVLLAAAGSPNLDDLFGRKLGLRRGPRGRRRLPRPARQPLGLRYRSEARRFLRSLRRSRRLCERLTWRSRSRLVHACDRRQVC